MSNTLSNIDPATNARFTDLGDGTYSEMISDQVQLFYNPANESCRAMFNALPFIQLAGKYHTLGGAYDIMEVDFSDKMTKCYGAGLTDPVTGGDLGQVSVGGVMLMIKAAMDTEYNARAEERAAAVARAEAMTAALDHLANSIVSPAPNGTAVDFSSANTGTAVDFTDASTSTDPNTITAWQWIFGDSKGLSNDQNPSYEYDNPGTYTVTLIVTDSTGKSVNANATITVSPAS